MKEILLRTIEDTANISLQNIFLRTGVSLIIGLFIFLSYFISHSGTIYSRKFNVSLVVLTVMTCTVMVVIANNVTLSLGMVGALSIVRFRTAVKDSRDTVYIFWTIVAGISCGAGDFITVGIGSAAIFLILLFFGGIKNDGRMLLIIRAARANEERIEAIVYQYFERKASLRVKNSNTDSIEFIYEISRKTLEKAQKAQSGAWDKSITNAIFELDDVEYCHIVAQNDEISG